MRSHDLVNKIHPIGYSPSTSSETVLDSICNSFSSTNINIAHHVSHESLQISAAAEKCKCLPLAELQPPIGPLNGYWPNISPLPLTLTTCTFTERPPLCFASWPRQHRLLEQRHLRPPRRRRLTRRRLLLLSNHRTETRSACSPLGRRTQDRAQTRSACSLLGRRTQDRALLPRSFSLGASKSLPRRRPRLCRFETRVRGGDQSQHEEIPLRASQQR